jgi:hypothetical protein
MCTSNIHCMHIKSTSSSQGGLSYYYVSCRQVRGEGEAGGWDLNRITRQTHSRKRCGWMRLLLRDSMFFWLLCFTRDWHITNKGLSTNYRRSCAADHCVSNPYSIMTHRSSVGIGEGLGKGTDLVADVECLRQGRDFERWR